jgi:molybdopterin synthase catalytic subunit
MAIDIEVSFYGNLTRVVGARTRLIRVEGDPPTVGDLRDAVVREYPSLESQLAHVAIGMGSEIHADDAVLRPDAGISLLPPVSGGEGPESEGSGSERSDPRRVQSEPLSLDALLRETEGVDAGALAVFGGTVRAEDRGESIAALDYDVHLEMAERAIRRIEDEIRSRDGVLACRIVHRVGSVPAGEPSVYVVVRARHRPEAFEAARDGIDRVKAEAPIWKEDVHPDGTRSARASSEGTPLTPVRAPNRAGGE